MCECYRILIGLCIVLLILFVITVIIFWFRKEERMQFLFLIKSIIYLFIAFWTGVSYVLSTPSEFSVKLSAAILAVSAAEAVTNAMDFLKEHEKRHGKSNQKEK